MKIAQIISLATILTIGYAIAERKMETCLKTNAQGKCVEKQYLETGLEICLARDKKTGTCIAMQNPKDYFIVKECTAPENGTCRASITLGDKTVECEARHGNSCTAKAKMSPFALKILGITQ